MKQSAFRAVAVQNKWSYDVAENVWLTRRLSVKYLDESGEGYIWRSFNLKTFKEVQIMLTKTNKNYSISVSPVRIAVFLLFILCVFAVSVNAQNSDKKNLPVWQSYKGVAIGMTADEIRTKLGAPKSEDSEGFFYIFSETENAQFLLDSSKKVRTISVVFTADHSASPNFADVFGKTAEVQAKPDGSIYKMVRYEDAGYWISYSRMAGEKAMVIVMIQKI